jgi:fluoride ion exporter CrcB/FEX
MCPLHRYCVAMSNPYMTPRAILAGVLAVGLGGFLGSLLRVWLTQPGDRSHGVGFQTSSVLHMVPWSLLGVNALGVALAVYLLRRLFSHQSFLDPTRLFLVTGFLGGLTSYSGLLVSVYAIWQVRPSLAISVGLGAILSGVIAGRVALALAGRRS